MKIPSPPVASQPDARTGKIWKTAPPRPQDERAAEPAKPAEPRKDTGKDAGKPKEKDARGQQK